ncbi:MAG TPA: ABC transporter ATP-binding protein [Acidimicrobiales bacterium]|nr:ABC transporter ATP-binding protein [Acidimicrobiales bacterium]
MSSAAETVLSVRDLSVSFPTSEGTVKAVQDVSFDIRAGEVLAVVGESGSGKSVTALAVMGLHPKSAEITGSARFGEHELLGLDDKTMRRIRGDEIAMIFQDPMTALNPVFTVGGQIAEAIWIHRDIQKKAAMERAAELLDLVGVPEAKRRARQYPHEYSGGMRQRAMIAMAIANDPKLLIADEPTTALDVTIQAQVIETMKAAQDATGAAMMLITHDLGLVAGLADRIQVMYGGRIVETGTTDEVFYGSSNPYTRGLMSSIPRLDAREAARLTPIPGAPPSLINLPKGCSFRPRCTFRTEICLSGVPELEEVAPGHSTRCFHSGDLPELEVMVEVHS